MFFNIYVWNKTKEMKHKHKNNKYAKHIYQRMSIVIKYCTFYA